MDITIVISTCKHSYNNIKELITQLENSNLPKENVLFVSGQETMNSITFEKGYKIIKVNYTGLQLTGAIYVYENIEDYKYTNYWVLLPDTIKFGKDFFNNLYFYYETYLKDNVVHSLPFINPNLRATMDLGIIHTQHLINLSSYWEKIKTSDVSHSNLLVLKKQLIYDENVILGLKPQVVTKSTVFEKPENFTKLPAIFITNNYASISECLINNNTINQIYFSQLDLYKYQKNFNGPDAPLVLCDQSVN